MRSPARRRVALFLLPFVALACAESGTGTTGPALRRDWVEVNGARLLSCAAPPQVSWGWAELDEQGGAMTVGRRALRVPAGALDGDHRVILATPASPFIEVQAHVEGFAHYTFRKPVSMTIDLSRCTDAELPSLESLHVVYIDPDTKQILEDMGGTVDPAARTITFETGHFSTYAVAE